VTEEEIANTEVKTETETEVEVKVTEPEVAPQAANETKDVVEEEATQNDEPAPAQQPESAPA